MNEHLPEGHKAYDVRLVTDPVRVDVGWIGEGLEGDYDSEDPTDRPLYRFDVYVRMPGTLPEADQWDEVENSSYCTDLDTSLPRQAVDEFAQLVMTTVHARVRAGQSVKRLCEELSTTPMSQFDAVVALARAAQMDDKTERVPTKTTPGPRI